MSWPSPVWVERPWPRRSWAMTRKPWPRKNSICVSQSSADERPAVTEHDRLARAPVLVEDLDAVLGGDRIHNEPLLAAVRAGQIGRSDRREGDLVGHCPRRRASHVRERGAADENRSALLCGRALLGPGFQAARRTGRITAHAGISNLRRPPPLSIDDLRRTNTPVDADATVSEHCRRAGLRQGAARIIRYAPIVRAAREL